MSTLLHVFKYPPGQGGMDAIQRLHMEGGERGEAVLPLLARPGTGQAGGGPWTSWGALRKRFLAEVAGRSPGASVYYNCWGADRLSDVDPAQWRIGYLHSDFPGFDGYVRHFSSHLNGFLCVSEGLAARVRRLLPRLPADQVWCAPIPRAGGGRMPASAEREFVIGYAGRLVNEQKRVDRLPALARELDGLGLRNWRLEILGDGPARAELETTLGADGRVRFLGWVDATGTRSAMERWRYHVTVSDYEGLSIALLESAAAGCLPVYPLFGDAGDPSDLPAGAVPHCVYPRGDMAAAAARIYAWERLSCEQPELAVGVREALVRFASERTPDHYLKFWGDWRAGLLTRAPAATPAARPGAWERIQPVWAYNRGYRRLVQGAR